MSNTTALCVTAGTEQVASIRKARALGLRVVAVDRNPDAPGLKEADVGIPLNPVDETAVIQLAKSYGIRLVLPVPIGRLITTVGAVNDALGLPGVTRQAAALCSDKLAFRQTIAQFGLMPTECVVARGRGEIINALKAFPLPCILKPRFGSGSRGVVVIQNEARIEELVSEHLALGNDPEETLIEGFVEGTEVGVDAAVTSGSITITSVRMKTVTPIPYRQTVGYHGPAPLSTKQFDELREVLQGAVTATGCNDSLLHFDVILRKGEMPYLIEMAPRPAGLRMAEVMVPAMTGIDFISEGIKMLLGQPAEFRPRRSTPVALKFLQHPPVRVPPPADFRTVMKYEGVVDVSIPRLKTPPVGKITCAADVLAGGYVVTVGSTLSEALQRAEKAAAGLYMLAGVG